MADFTPTQGRYLAFIRTYTDLHGIPPSESEIASAMCVSPPSVNLMVKTLEKKGLIHRQPGKPRSLQVIIPEDEIPQWNNRKHSARQTQSSKQPKNIETGPPGNLFVFSIYLLGGPRSENFTNKEISRKIEIRGDQTLEQFHKILFEAFDRHEEHLYEFQLGKRPFDPDGPNFSLPSNSGEVKKGGGDVRTTRIDDLNLKSDRVFGYLFDFGDKWFHKVQVERIEKAIPTVTYPRIIKRVGKSPPQYDESRK